MSEVFMETHWRHLSRLGLQEYNRTGSTQVLAENFYTLFLFPFKGMDSAETTRQKRIHMLKIMLDEILD